MQTYTNQSEKSSPFSTNGNNPIAHAYDLFGKAVLIPIHLYKKSPWQDGWQTITHQDSKTFEHQSLLRRAVRQGGNFGILLGSASDNLVAIDFDLAGEIEKFLAEHPFLVPSMRTVGTRTWGGQVWMRMEGPYPEVKFVLYNDVGEQMGEFRGGGGHQSVWFGQARQEKDILGNKIPVEDQKIFEYQRVVDAPPVVITYDQIREWVEAHSRGTKRERRTNPGDLDWTKDPAFSNCNFRTLNAKGMLEAIGHKIKRLGDPNDPKEKYKIYIECPWIEEHTGGETERECVVWAEPGQWPTLNCFHSHCVGRGFRDLCEYAEGKQKGVVARFCLAPVYDHKRQRFWIPNNQGRMIQARQELLESYLVSHNQLIYPEGYEKLERAEKGRVRKALVQQKVLHISEEFSVEYAGPLAGYHIGFQEVMGLPVLVTESPKLITPKQGPFPLITQILSNMFGKDGREDLLYFHLWNKSNIESLYNRQIRPGMALLLCGPKSAGKNLVQSRIITPLLGGRMCDPTQYALKDSSFNDDMIRSEHLMIADQRASNQRSADLMGAFIKSITGNREVRLHAKGVGAFSSLTYHRLSISFNEKEEDLEIIPPADDEAVLTKTIILYAEMHPMPLPTATPQEEEIFGKAIEAELPAYVHYLQNLEVPKTIRVDRFWIKSYCSPKVMALLEQYSDEGKLLQVIDESDLFRENLGGKPMRYWQGTSSDLVDFLDKRIVHLAKEPKQMGRLLKALSKRKQPRVSSTTSKGVTHYTISAPI
jgi:hypothetical protein